MDDYESLSHTSVVFILQYRRKALYSEFRQYLGHVFRKLAFQKESRIEPGHLKPDHEHMMISILPKYSISQVESAMHLARKYGRRSAIA
jgi:putative transposase